MQPSPAQKTAMIAAYHDMVASSRDLFPSQSASLSGEAGQQGAAGIADEAPDAIPVRCSPFLTRAGAPCCVSDRPQDTLQKLAGVGLVFHSRKYERLDSLPRTGRLYQHTGWHSANISG